MHPTARDYTWFTTDQRLAYLRPMYCITYVRSVTPGELLARLGATDVRSYPNLTELGEPSRQAWENSGGTVLLVAAMQMGECSLAVELGGFLGSEAPRLAALSRGTRAVSHYYCSFNGVGRFLWAEDGDIRLSFEPLFAHGRAGSAPDAALEAMRQIGFAVDLPKQIDDLDNWDDNASFPVELAACALAGHLAGVRVTADQLADGPYLAGLVP